MRKCGACGYLLLGEGATCGRCGGALPVVKAAAPAAVSPTAAVAALRGSAPPPPAWAPPPPAAPPMPASEQFALREAWQPVTVSAPPAAARPARATRLGVGVLAGVVAVALFLGVTHLRSDPLPKGTATYASGGGVAYTAPDGGFQVLLPQTPALDQRTATVDGVTATLYAAAVNTDDYEIGALSVVLPSPVLSRRIDDVLESALTGGINGVNGKLVHKSMLTHDTLPAIEGSFKLPDGYRAHVLVVASGSTLVLLFVHAKTGTDRLYKALEASLIVR